MGSDSFSVASGPASASVQPWAERSKWDVFLDALAGVRPGTPRGTLRSYAPILLIIAVVAFLLPNVVVLLESDDSNPSLPFYLLLVAIGVGQAALDQYRFGRSLSRLVIAAFGSLLQWLVMLGTFVVCSLVLGQPAEGSRLYAAIDAIFPDIPSEVAILLLSIGAIAIVIELLRRAARGFPEDKRSATMRDAIRAERSARAAATGRETAPLLG